MDAGRAEDRRTFLKQAGTVAWATPLVLTMAASKAGAQAVSCVPHDGPCGFYDATFHTCLGVGTCCDTPGPATCIEAASVQGSPCTCIEV